ncbi:MAG: deoxyribose-phosphate aldolase [Sphingobacteriales bacterium]|nr:MAG: deoxyribose-phosphate aldolase [Sphingobacteriales bacterium]
MTVQAVAAAIDHTALKPTLTTRAIAQLCEEAVLYQFAAVCVPPCYVKMACELLQGTPIAVATVIGFPLGYSTTETKEAEINEALHNGATEIDVVHNISFIKSGDEAHATREIEVLTQQVHARGGRIKVILETSYLTDAEIVACCRQYGALGVDFVKTSTGFSDAGAQVEHVRLMRQSLPDTIRIKASGGIRTLAEAQAMLAAGADRLGTSAGVQIISEMTAPGETLTT